MFESSVLGRATVVAPGPDAAVWLDGVDPEAGDLAAVTAGLAVLQDHLAWAASIEARLLARAQALADRAVATDPDGREWVSAEVGAVLRLRGDYAAVRMRSAATLVRRLPDTLTLLHAGSVSPVQARMLAEQVTDLTDEVGLSDDRCARIESRVLARAPEQSSTQFRHSLRRAVLAIAPRTAEQAHAAEAADRRVFTAPGSDGMGWLMSYLPVAELMIVKSGIWRLAQANKNTADREAREAGEAGDGAGFVSIDAYRADALVELASRYLTDTDPRGTLNRLAPAIRVTVSLETLLGDSDEPGELAGYGPIPPSLARHLAADPDGTWQRMVTDPLGRLIDLGRTRYRPPKSLADHVKARDQICGFPTCNRAAESCELDHVCDWAKHGTTCAENLIPLCSLHHHLKHNGNWHITYDPTTGITEWTTPTGRHYINRPPELPGAG